MLPAESEAGGVPSGTEAYHSFDHGPVHVVVFDTSGNSVAGGRRMLDEGTTGDDFRLIERDSSGDDAADGYR